MRSVFIAGVMVVEGAFPAPRAQQNAEAPPARATASGAPMVAPAPMLQQRFVQVPGGRAAEVTAEVQAPFAVVASVLTEFGRYNEFVPRVSTSRIVQRRRGEVDVYLGATLSDNYGTAWSRMRFVVHREPEHLRIEGVQVDGSMAVFDCQFEVEPTPGAPDRSRVTMRVRTVPRFPFPTIMLDAAHSRWSVRGMTALRERAEARARQQSP